MKRQSIIKALSIAVLSVAALTACKTGFHKEEGKVWYYEWTTLQGSVRTEVDSVDYESFETLDHDYAHDKRYAWHRLERLDGVDGSAFESLKRGYARDQRHVFFEGRRIERVDAPTFKLKGSKLAEDKNDCFWEGRALGVKDRSAFKVLGDQSDYRTSWAVDGKYAYFLDRRGLDFGHNMPLADAATFEPIMPKNKKQDQTGDYLSYEYARDRYQVYYCDTLVVGADAATFEEVRWHIARDKNHTYGGNTRMPDCADFRTLKEIQPGLYRDSLHVFDGDSILEGVDPQNFNHWKYIRAKQGLPEEDDEEEPQEEASGS